MSTSANAGKVMLGADGCPLRGHDGKIVLADSIYPMRANSRTITGWRRGIFYESAQVETLTAANCTSPTGDDSWVDGQTTPWYKRTITDRGEGFPGGRYHISWMNQQCVQKFSSHRFFAGGSTYYDIDWARVAKVKITWIIYKLYGGDSGTTYNVHIGNASATEPSGANEPWEGSGWSLLASVVDSGYSQWDIAASGSFFVTDVSDGLTYYTAFYIQEPGGTGTIETGRPPFGFSSALSAPNPQVYSYPEIVYNLAT